MYRTLFERLDDPLEIRDPQGRCLARNAAARKAPLPEQEVMRALATGSARFVRDGRLLSIECLPLEGELKALRVVADSPSTDPVALIARMAHDLTEPLRLATMYSQLLERRLGDLLDGTARHQLDVVRANIDRMQRAVDGLRELASITRTEPLDEEVALHSLLTEVVASLGEEARDAHVIWVDLPVVRGSSALLGKIFGRLLDNAVLYRSDASPELRIQADRSDHSWRVHVQDNGIGIDPAHQERIFEPFRRLHAYDERAGTGIGLAWCRRAAELMGGGLYVTSTPGRGSRFTLELPAA